MYKKLAQRRRPTKQQMLAMYVDIMMHVPSGLMH